MKESFKKEIQQFLLVCNNFFTQKEAKVIEKVKELTKLMEMLPIESTVVEEKRLLVIDINYLPSEYKEKSVTTTEELLSQKYGTKVLLIDSHKNNIQYKNNNNKPAYFI